MLNRKEGVRAATPSRDMRLRLPALRAGVVERSELVRRLSSTSAALVSIAAPAGYGSTTLLAQWAAVDHRAFAYLALEAEDNDPAALLAHLAEVLDRVEPMDPVVSEALGASMPGRALAALGTWVASGSRPFVLALDNTHVVGDRDARRALATLATYVREGSAMVFAGRREPPIPSARLRSQGRLVELGARDLSLDEAQVRAVLESEGLTPSDGEVATIWSLTEGWPVAVYLAAAALVAGVLRTAEELAGDVQPIGDYIRFELLAGLSRKRVDFMTRTSVLGRMSGPLCDAVLETRGSQRALEKLGASTHLLVPLDGSGSWFRYHRLVRQELRSQLERGDPLAVAGLLRRAADWCEEHDQPDEAVGYAMEIGDVDRVAGLFSSAARDLYGAGGEGAVLQRLDWLAKHGAVDGRVGVLALGAWLQAFAGRPAEADRLADMLDRLPIRSEPPTARAVVRAALCREGVERMRLDAETAAADLASPWRPAALLLLGVAYGLEGKDDVSADVLTAASEQGDVHGQADVALAAVTQLARRASERGDWLEAESLLERVASIRGRFRLDRYAVAALGFALSAQAALRRGEMLRANDELTRATALRPLLTHAVPWLAVQTQMELLRAHVALGDASGARTVLREIDDVLRRRPELGTLGEAVETLRTQTDALRTQRLKVTALTAAELRLLPYLATHLTFREIGDRLYLSPNTVKTQAVSIYRKFGVTSRTAAIAHAEEIGIVGS